MSLGGRRNLFEMKHQQQHNKYSQLIEAQTPEPAEVVELHTQDDTIKNSEMVSLESEAKQSSPVLPNVEGVVALKIETDTKLQQDNTTTEGTKPSDRKSPSQDEATHLRDNTRKTSQTSSQMSTSFMSTASSSRQSSLGPVVPSTDPRSLGSQASCSLPSGESSSNLDRSVSRSMLKLDQSARADRFEVSWRELSFSYMPGCMVGMRKKPTHVLRNISGKFESNQLVAVIGPSGCGKTTLLQFLAGNNASHKDRLRIVGLEEPKVAFIGQDDCLLPGLTARETLMFASRLQNNEPEFDHEQHIEPIIGALGLHDCADRNVTKLSGGQAKRVTIAQELLYPTNLLILDEVTSGLDASTSYAIVRLLKQLVSDNTYPMSIVMSIHQPSARLFAVFDRVYVMSEGCCLYEGSCQVDTVNTHLSRFGLACPKFHNIADYLIEIASEDTNSGSTIKEKLVQHHEKQSSLSTVDSNSLHATWNSSSEHEFKCNEGNQDESQISMLMSSSLYSAVERARSRRERPLLRQMAVHFVRSLVRIRRSYILTYLQLITYVLLGLQLATFYGPDIGTLSGCPQLPMSFVAFIFSNEPNDGLSLEMRRIQENMNFLLVAVMTATFAALEITVITFPLEAKTIKREWRNGWYRVSSYFVGRTLADLPFQLVFVIVFCIVVYSLTGQVGLTTWRFASFVAIIVMIALIAQTVGFIFGALFMNNLPAAVFTAPLCIFPALLFSGFFSRVSQIPPFYKPMTYVSHFRYAFDALLVTLYGYGRCNCDQTTLQNYHEGLDNQTSTIRSMFQSLFGSADCASQTPSPEENSIEDTIVHGDPSTMVLNATTLGALSTPMPNMTSLHTIKPLEDALVDSVFEHMLAGNNSTTESSASGGTAMDHLVSRFSNRVTIMLNSQSNFGHPVPKSCNDFNSYLMTEFNLRNHDLMFGLVMLFLMVILTRLLCNAILSFTIATRTT